MLKVASSLVMRRLSGIEPKNRVRIDVRIEAEIAEIMRKNALNPSDVMNIGAEKVLVSQGYLPDIAIKADPCLLLDPEILTTIQDNRLNVSTILNTGARMLLRDKGLLS
ncbi:hypothetical protein MettiDRAFT_0008 [Methanolobus tindarius DSM 2278]|uniref:Uncharacterized protein n=1 Tax=Methanolobus tindarius DSM 2278 TaxID=1090322 RepID=W9DT75_METTI|nr:hypothetical protein [Methanolobus tindarius]ETA66611.1 hypothetical protein MettiDRAFT_0008 [Methanolobus tindarius DSM 2278]